MANEVYAGVRSQKDFGALKALGLHPVILDVAKESTAPRLTAEIYSKFIGL